MPVKKNKKTIKKAVAKKPVKKAPKKAVKKTIAKKKAVAKKPVKKKVAAKKPAKKAVAKKKIAKKPVKKTATKKKTTKKIVEKVAKKPVKKTVTKKVTKKPTKKIAVKKTTKKPVKKTAPKTKKTAATKKPAKKTTAPAKKAEAKPQLKKAKTDESQFAIDDYVIYPSHGIGRVIDTEKVSIMGSLFSCYLIFFEREKLTIKVPVANAKEVNLRHIVDKKTIEEVFAILRSGVKKMKGMWSRRAQEYETKINSGDIFALAEVLRDLARDIEDGDRSYSERIIYETAIARLASEYAAIYGIDLEEAKEIVINTSKDKLNSDPKDEINIASQKVRKLDDEDEDDDEDSEEVDDEEDDFDDFDDDFDDD